LDDFVVPAGQTWSITSISVMGTWFGASATQPTTFAITIFNRNHIMCRADVTVQPIQASSSSTNGVVTVINLPTPCYLVGGAIAPEVAGILNNRFNPLDETYYITVWPEVDFARTGNSWYWSFSNTKNGETFKFKDTETVFPNHACKTWTDATQCGLQLQGHTDLCFVINGRQSDSTPADVYHLNKAELPLRDGNIGTDVGHSRLLTSDEADQRLFAQSELADFSQNQDIVTSQTETVYAPVSSTSPSGHPAWVVPVVVTLCVVAALALLALLTWGVFKKSHVVEIV